MDPFQAISLSPTGGVQFSVCDVLRLRSGKSFESTDLLCSKCLQKTPEELWVCDSVSGFRLHPGHGL